MPLSGYERLSFHAYCPSLVVQVDNSVDTFVAVENDAFDDECAGGIAPVAAARNDSGTGKEHGIYDEGNNNFEVPDFVVERFVVAASYDFAFVY